MAGGILPQASEIPRSSRSRLSEQSFELGGDRLDGVEVGSIFGRKTTQAPTSRIAFRTASPLWEPRLSATDIGP